MLDDLKKLNLPEIEKEILDFWNKNKIFEKTLKKKAVKGEFIFYDGPPFANGLPHYGSLLGSIVKDVIPRYKTMQGYYVRRRWGWDCHGLPIENMVEKKLHLKDKTEIEKIGVKKFNEACRDSVLRYARDWKKFIDRVGRWTEYDRAYMTMDAAYTESVWWALKKIHDKGLLYEGKKILLYCPRCETPIAKAEVQMDNSYKDIVEEAVTVKFKVKNPEQKGLPKDTYLLAWTTTPWTLPGNVALAVRKDITYSLIEGANEHIVIAASRFEELGNLPNTKTIFKKNIKGKALLGLEYEPLYKIKEVEDSGKKAWYVSDADFVNTEEGTGIVHTAVIYGEDDYELGMRLDLPMVPLLDEKGIFTNKAPKFIQGRYFKKAEKAIKENLEKRNLIFKKEKYAHSYPHCHRCDTALFYNAVTSWFINIQKIKNKLIKLNAKINWFPEHLKLGRFLKIIESAPDWTISRNRYWASPLPIWKSETGKTEVISSFSELKEKIESGNRYFFMRHGEAESNVAGILNSDIRKKDSLTNKGRREAKKSGLELSKKKIDFIYASDFIRTKETAKIVAKSLGIPQNKIIYDKRIRELNAGKMSGKTLKEYHSLFGKLSDKFNKAPDGGETYRELRRRVGEFLFEIEASSKNKNVLVISHGAIISTARVLACGLSNKDVRDSDYKKAKTGEVVKIDFSFFPHNADYEIDCHRPYIDEITWVNDEGEVMKRVPEVVDGWLEAASMPFSEYHYPFENKNEFKKRFPGDFISEYIAQTRTWFYYMLVISAILFDDTAFKNVLTTGTILAEDGSKMSKSKGNYTDPIENLDKYGADSLRYYFMSSVVMRAEDLNFSDLGIKEAQNKVLNLLLNSFYFYKMYSFEGSDLKTAHNTKLNLDGKNILDKWIKSRLNQLKLEVTDGLENFDVIKATRPIKDFISDFSHWYIRRSRNRFKSEDTIDKKNAAVAMRYILIELSKLTAPFMPFISDFIYKGLRGEKESVHLEDWPKKAGEPDKKIIRLMNEARKIVGLALQERAKHGIKIKQPIALLKIKNQKSGIKNHKDLLKILREEINVKKIVFDSKIETEVEIDTRITQELYREGIVRELTRAAQRARQEAGCDFSDLVDLKLRLPEEFISILKENLVEFKRLVKAKKLDFINLNDKKSSRLVSYAEYKINGKTLFISIGK